MSSMKPLRQIRRTTRSCKFIRRYERQNPGEQIHIDIKKLVRPSHRLSVRPSEATHFGFLPWPLIGASGVILSNRKRDHFPNFCAHAVPQVDLSHRKFVPIVFERIKNTIFGKLLPEALMTNSLEYARRYRRRRFFWIDAGKVNPPQFFNLRMH